MQIEPWRAVSFKRHICLQRCKREAGVYVALSKVRLEDRQTAAIQPYRFSITPSPVAVGLTTQGHNMKIAMVLTSHDQLGSTGKKTGLWLEEFVAPYYVFKDAGVDISVVSPKGGHPPLDPKSDAPDAQTDATRRFKTDTVAQSVLAHTSKLSSITSNFDAVFYPGGHGPLWDLANDTDSIHLIESMAAAGKTVAAVCHAPGVLRHVKAPDGTPLVAGKKVTGFANTEEAAAGLTDIVPFLVEDMLVKNGGRYSKGPDWQSFVVMDGNLITGQNPASSKATAQAVLDQLTTKP